MNLDSMFDLQKQLDERIRKEHRMEDCDLINEKILAFQVELGELANETRCFKYWSVKPSSERDVILEEYVDGVHFLLSIGLDLEINVDSLKEQRQAEQEHLTQQFSLLFSLSSKLQETKVEKEFILLFQEYLLLGQLLKFTPADIEKAYIGKNEINHQRQNEGY